MVSVTTVIIPIIVISLYIGLCFYSNRHKIEEVTQKQPEEQVQQDSTIGPKDIIRLELINSHSNVPSGKWIDNSLELTDDVNNAAYFDTVLDKDGNKLLRLENKYLTMVLSKYHTQDNDIVLAGNPSIFSYLSIRKTPKTQRAYIKFKTNYYVTLTSKDTDSNHPIPLELQKKRMCATYKKELCSYFIVHP